MRQDEYLDRKDKVIEDDKATRGERLKQKQDQDRKLAVAQKEKQDNAK